MRICHTSPIKLLEINKRKQYNTLNINNLGGGTAQYIIHLTYFDFVQHKYSETTFSDATQGHLTDASCLQVQESIEYINRVLIK